MKCMSSTFHPHPARARRYSHLVDARLYLCTDARTGRGDLREFLHACYAGGVDIIQLRDKHISAREEIAAINVLKEVAAQHKKLFAVNDRADIAQLTGADILHLGQEDLTTWQARQIVGEEMLLGRSNRTLSMFSDSLADDGIDYAVIGPVWATPTKPGRAPVGIETIRDAAQLVQQHQIHGTSKPWWAIGGIDSTRVQEVRAAGAPRIVVVRALTESTNPETAARALRAAITQLRTPDPHEKQP